MDGRRFNYQPEGFMEWAKEFASSGRPLPMFLNHNSESMPVGEWTSIEMDDEGMSASGRLFLNTSAGSDLYQVMCESPNMFGGVSVGAYADEYQMVNADGEPDQSEEAYFQITKGGLRETSVVMYPNNPKAEVKKLEYFRADGSADLKVLEEALRDAEESAFLQDFAFDYGAGLKAMDQEILEIIGIIRKIRDSGVTILLIEHVMHAVMSLSDHIHVLSYGKIIAEGKPQEVVSNRAVIEAYLGRGAAEQIAQTAPATVADGHTHA
jgi:HK97 family phage prohead protease